ncbi:tripartite tricarboxylate transporter substrate-binding protein [Paracidovorax anthurii]|uniref:Tripartite-type tricarboxylate transporter receptor subunit TctC n=1 Tax=Paracidovorax anthurii TaxID=78229 RepID=A0A328YYM3_9BURK|nr:tripartite tricarboxylate transporter substrate-binding protein [Paracidovorax anthurii]RAR79121.1 tripartite-type tricarboxylate transporter receptor subunit TctC [Paracidovorax anthurii]
MAAPDRTRAAPQAAMHPTRRAMLVRSLACAAALPAAGWAPSASAAVSPVPGSARILVGFGAGGGIDLLGRTVAERIGPLLGPGHHVIVDNRPGASGQIAAQALLGAPPDGATYLLAPLITPVLSQIVYRKPGYDPATDFVPVGLVAHFQFALAVPANHPAKTVDEFIAWLRAHPDRANFGSPAAGSLPHFFGLLLGSAAKVDIVHVAYKGGAPMLNDLVGGQLSSAIQTVTELLPLYRQGRIRILGTFSDKRTRELPNVPTFSESGYPRAVGSGWYSLWARGGTPPAAVAAVNRALNQSLGEPAVRGRLTELALDPDPRTPAQLEALRVAEIAKWRPVVEASGFIAD